MQAEVSKPLLLSLANEDLAPGSPSSTRVRFPCSDRKQQRLSEREETQAETEESIKALELQLAQEEKMSDMEDFTEVEREYLRNYEDPNSRLKYACVMIRRSKMDEKQTGLRILYALYRECISSDSEVEIAFDKLQYRTVIYYLVVGNYRLGFIEESKRFVHILLELEPQNSQAATFKQLLETKSIKKFMVVIDTTYESSLAFDRTLRLLGSGDELLLVTIVDQDEVEKILKEQGAQQLPAYESLKLSKADDIAESIQQRYRLICNERNISHNYIHELGDAREDISEVIQQEQVDVCVVPFGSLKSKGFFSRVRLTNLSEYLYHNGQCDVVVVKEKGSE